MRTIVNLDLLEMRLRAILLKISDCLARLLKIQKVLNVYCAFRTLLQLPNHIIRIRFS